MTWLLRALLLAGLAVGALTAQARTSVPLVDPVSASFAAGAAPDAASFKAAVVRAGATREWTLKSEADGVLTLNLLVRGKHAVVVDVKPDDQGYRISFVSCVNLNFEEKDGTRLIHPNYNVWVQNLNLAIQKELAALPPR